MQQDVVTDRKIVKDQGLVGCDVAVHREPNQTIAPNTVACIPTRIERVGHIDETVPSKVVVEGYALQALRTVGVDPATKIEDRGR